MILEHRLILDLRLLNNRGYASLLKKYKDNPHGLEDYGEEKKKEEIGYAEKYMYYVNLINSDNPSREPG